MIAVAGIVLVISMGWRSLLVGHAPFSGPDPVQVLLEQLNGEVPRLVDQGGRRVSEGLATIVEKLYLGDVTELELTLSDENRVTSRVQSRDDQKFGFKEGDAVSIGWNAEDCNLLSD